jgi:hypothetical protein
MFDILREYLKVYESEDAHEMIECKYYEVSVMMVGHRTLRSFLT